MLIESEAGKRVEHTAFLAKPEGRTDLLAGWIESRSGLFLTALFALFIFRFIAFDIRPFWYDEHFTLAVARLHSFGAMWVALKDGLDLNPPLSYWITHVSMTLFGQNELAARLPSALGFFFFAVAGYVFVSRKCGKLAGLNTAFLILITAPATIVGEARPYGMLLAFAGLAFVSWQSASAGTKRYLYLPLMTLSLCAALLCHCYAVLLLVPLAGAELARSAVHKRIDWAMLLSLLAAVPTVVTYLPVLASAKRLCPWIRFRQ